MKCEDAREHFSAYLDDMLEQDLRVLLEDHLNKCEGCNEEFNELKSLIGIVSSLDQVKAPRDFLDKVKNRLEPGFSFNKLIKSLFFPLQIKIPIQAATITVSALLVFALVQQLQRSSDQFPAISPPKPVTLPKMTGKESIAEKAETPDRQRFIEKEDRDSETPPSPKSYEGEKATSDKEILESEKSRIASSKLKKEIELEQPSQKKENDQLNDLVLKTGTPEKVSPEKRIFEKSTKRLKSDEAIRMLPVKKEVAFDVAELKKEPSLKPIEVILFIDPARQKFSETLEMKTEGQEKIGEVAEGAMTKKEGALSIGQQDFPQEAKQMDQSSEDQVKSQQELREQDASELATEGILAEIQQMVFEFKGKVISSIQSPQVGVPPLIKTEIPKQSFHDFCNKLKTLSPQTLCPSINRVPDQDMIPVDIKIVQQ